jgi:hypothetical protein
VREQAEGFARAVAGLDQQLCSTKSTLTVAVRVP